MSERFIIMYDRNPLCEFVVGEDLVSANPMYRVLLDLSESGEKFDGDQLPIGPDGARVDVPDCQVHWEED